MLQRRLPYMFQQVRHMTARRPKYEHAENRASNTAARLTALGQREWPAITLSRDDVVFSIQQTVFGYDRGGEGFARPGFKVAPGKTPVPARTGRKYLKKAAFVPKFSEWYPPDYLGTVRFKEMRMMKKSPEHEIATYLGTHKMKEHGEEDFGPFQIYEPNHERAIRRTRAHRVLESVKEDPELTALTSTEEERRRLDTIEALRKRGKAAPKKGQGKRATGGGKKK